MRKIQLFWQQAWERHHQANALLKSKNIPGLFNQEFAFYLRRINREYQATFHQVLKKRLDLHPIHLNRFFHTPMGEEILTRFEDLIHIQGDDYGKYALRGALLQTAEDPEGLSILNLLRKFSANMQFNTERILLTIKRVELLLKETEAMVDTISQLAKAEAAAELSIDFSKLPDIRCPGKASVEKQTLILNDKSRESRQFRAILYKPRWWRPGKAPVVVMSHGLGSSPEDFAEYAEHLASYGHVVAVPQHPGSDSNQVQEMLSGYSQEVFKLKEFIDRPLDVTYLLDQLERRNPVEYQGKLNLEAVGVIGHSFGGYTALALAGAEIDFEKLENACGPVLGSPNPSLLLQCRALRLPRKTYNFRDHRVKAVLPIDPVGSEVFGPKGLCQIQIPVFMVAGSEDKTAPAAFEQIRVFTWLTTSNRYLALIKGKSHFGSFSKLETGLKLMLLKTLPNLMGPDATLLYSYAYAMSLAFIEVYVANNPEYRPYLQSSYASYLSQAPFNLYLISAASDTRLSQKLRDFRMKLSQLS